MSARVLASLAILVTACTVGGGGRRTPSSDGGSTPDGGGGTSDVGTFDRPDAPRPDTGIVTGDCSEAARWIYLVDGDSSDLLRYEPDSGSITRVGTLACAGAATPFSMAVDRHAIAYVLHNDHRIYQASTVDGSCTSTSYVPNGMGFELFGMGFVSDAAGSRSERLFIAGGPEAGIGGGSATLGAITLPDWSVSRIGGVTGSPELTGNGDGELWGFFPDSTPMSVRQLDKSTGSTLQTFDVSAVDTGFLPIPSAWAFAYWGGRYYIFYMGALDASTNIFRLTPSTGRVEPVIIDSGYRIVGAGVSTCAPTILI